MELLQVWSKKNRRLQWRLLAFACGGFCYILIWSQIGGLQLLATTGDTIKNNAACGSNCRQISSKRHDGLDMSNISDVVKAFDIAKAKMIKNIELEYGEYYHTLFEEEVNEGKTRVSRGRTVFRSSDTSDVSWDRLKEQLMIKILNVQHYIQREECDCESASSNNNNPNITRNIKRSIPLPAPGTTPNGVYERFIFATAGHSSSAGHGNFEHQSYTKVMERTVSTVFEAIGMEFEGRNYGMSARSSAPHLAMCINQVYGNDVDLLAWDFGQTDARDYWKMAMFFYRAALHHPNHPTLLGLHLDKKRHHQILKLAKTTDMPALAMCPSGMEQVLSSMPDMHELSEEEIQKFPRMVQNFHCQGAYETSGNMGCPTTMERFNLSVCPERWWVAKWHPGWRRLALSGTLLALFLVEVLQDAIQELEFRLKSGKDLEMILTKLLARQSQNFKKLEQVLIPPASNDYFKTIAGLPDETIQRLYKGRSLCHTALLPGASIYIIVRCHLAYYYCMCVEQMSHWNVPLSF
jgi:hypothetical protein